MSALKQTLIERLDALPEPALRQVMAFLSLPTRPGDRKEPSLLSVAGGLSGTPLSADEIERALYERRETR